jgi:seryl-tRNA synthetase
LIEISFLREHSEVIKKDLEKRGDAEKILWIPEILSLDEQYKKKLQQAQELRAKRNEFTAKIDALRREKKDFKAEVEKARELPKKIKLLEEESEALKKKIDYYLMRLPNVLHDSVPEGKSEEDNVVVRQVGKPKEFSFEPKHHGKIAAELGIADFERAVKISGAGFFFLKGELALLDFALQRLAIDILSKKGYTLVQPPFMMNRKAYEGVTDLADFENVMYKIDSEDQYLIATSEHPMAAMYSEEIIEEKDLPIKLAGVSSCFRREIGKHGLDERGLFRVHQFNKIEQFIFCKPEDSWKFHEEILANAEEMLKTLEIPYNVTSICTGDIGTVAAKKYDINGWSPREKNYFELMSCSNCTAYQSARLKIRLRRKNGEKELLHTLNSTMVATTRTLRAIIENYQTENGTIKIPKALQPYMNGTKEIKKPTS